MVSQTKESCFSQTSKSAADEVKINPRNEKQLTVFKDKELMSMLKSANDDGSNVSMLKAREELNSDAKTSPNTLPAAIPSMERLPRFNVEDEFICGWGAAFINITATFPVNKAIFRQQLQGIGGYRALRQLKNEGLRNLYRGLLPPLMQKTTSLSIMFGSYHNFQLSMDAAFPAVPRPVNHAAAAMAAGTLEMMLCPFERIQTLLQDRTYHLRFNNTFHAAKELRVYGFREYYRGGTLIFLRNGPSNVFFFLGREFLNDHVPESYLATSTSRLAKDFLCGACLGAMISTTFFPLNVVKTRMQSRLGEPRGPWQTFQEVWVERNRKVSNLFRGFHLNYTRSFISWGIINASYECLMRLFRRLRAEGLL